MDLPDAKEAATEIEQQSKSSTDRHYSTPSPIYTSGHVIYKASGFGRITMRKDWKKIHCASKVSGFWSVLQDRGYRDSIASPLLQ